MASGGAPREWSGIFAEICEEFPDRWTLTKVPSLPDISEISQYGWKQFKDTAKVMFRCRRCKHKWTSVKGQVIFHYRLTRGPRKKGQVKMFLPGQACQACNSTIFEPSKWYNDQRVKVMENLQQKLDEKFYTMSYGGRPNQSRRSANMTSNHREDLCEACQLGFCPRKNQEEEEYSEEEYSDHEEECSHGRWWSSSGLE
ncbi:receptor-transporting protein 4-like [Branchiostoma floridae]|uniref:Receptor-transporting protein 4-like n=1 Tax=Branchiostoma floridae TaxID=7739 RepID=A0A9J7NDK1_BRAFL|nr:receptor-transporting protein 4-like [Branchiostoma floridae]